MSAGYIEGVKRDEQLLAQFGAEVVTPADLALWARTYVFGTQKEAADYLRLDASTISRYESGRAKVDIGYIAFLVKQLGTLDVSAYQGSEGNRGSYREYLLRYTNEIITRARIYGLRFRFHNWNHLCEVADKYERERHEATKGREREEEVSTETAETIEGSAAQFEQAPANMHPSTPSIARQPFQLLSLFLLLTLALGVTLVSIAAVVQLFTSSGDGGTTGLSTPSPVTAALTTGTSATSEPTPVQVPATAPHTPLPPPALTPTQERVHLYP